MIRIPFKSMGHKLETVVKTSPVTVVGTKVYVIYSIASSELNTRDARHNVFLFQNQVGFMTQWKDLRRTINRIVKIGCPWQCLLLSRFSDLTVWLYTCLYLLGKCYQQQYQHETSIKFHCCRSLWKENLARGNLLWWDELLIKSWGNLCFVNSKKSVRSTKLLRERPSVRPVIILRTGLRLPDF